MEDLSDENSDDGSDVSDGSQKRVCIFIQKNTMINVVEFFMNYL